MLAPLMKDIAILQRDGVYISSVGQNVKGRVFCVVADNLGAHSISGLVESFSGPYICRFCLGHRAEYQRKKVRFSGFPARTKDTHASHLLTMRENRTLTHCYGVKKACPLTRTSEPLALCHRLST